MEYIFVYLAGGLLYATLEMLWRGWTHWTMLLCGGACFTLMYLISGSRMSLPRKWILSTAAVTTAEYFTGCLVNLRLGMNVWDYSTLPGNVLGQICPRFILIWLVLSVPGVWLCGQLRTLLRG